MSTSDLYSVFKTKATHLKEYRNGHGTGPAIWGYVSEKYLGRERFGSLHGDASWLWKSYKSENIPYHARLCLAFTYDYMVCKPENIKTVAEALITAGSEIKLAYPEYVCHFEGIGADLKEIKLDKRALGVGLSCTSVCDPWISYTGESKEKFFCCVEETPMFTNTGNR